MATTGEGPFRFETDVMTALCPQSIPWPCDPRSSLPGPDGGDGVAVGAVGDAVIHRHLVGERECVGGGSGRSGGGEEVGCGGPGRSPVNFLLVQAGGECRSIGRPGGECGPGLTCLRAKVATPVAGPEVTSGML